MKSVLIVEDDKDIAKALQLRLEAIGHQVSVAYDAVTATTVARRCNPDVALLDVSMPGGDGFLVAERLQSYRGDLPLIFVTADKRQEVRDKAIAMGAQGFFEKPFASDQLMNAIEAA